jgi:hypothetical protein
MDFDWDNPAVAEQVPINQAIAEGLIDFIPESWRAAELRLGFGAVGGGVSQQSVDRASSLFGERVRARRYEPGRGRRRGAAGSSGPPTFFRVQRLTSRPG